MGGKKLFLFVWIVLIVIFFVSGVLGQVEEEYEFVGKWGVSLGTYIGGEFGHPTGIAVDSEGFVYVVDTTRANVQKFQKKELTTQFIRGDANRDGIVDLSDVIYTLTYLFNADQLVKPVACFDALDVDDSGILDISDAIYLLAHLFLGEQAPPAPFLEGGIDNTADDLSCLE